MVNLKQIARCLEGTKIPSMDEILKDVHAGNEEALMRELASEISRRKLEAAGYDFEQVSSDSYLIKADRGVIVKAIPGKLLEDDRKAQVVRYRTKLQRELKDVEGLVYFLPFQFNGWRLREDISKDFQISFVDLKYGENAIRRAFERNVGMDSHRNYDFNI